MNDETLTFLLERSGNPDGGTPPIYAEPTEESAAPAVLELALLALQRYSFFFESPFRDSRAALFRA